MEICPSDDWFGDFLDGPGWLHVLSRWQRVMIYTVAGFVLIEIYNIVFWWLASVAIPLTAAAETQPNAVLFNQFAEVLRLSVFLC